jgi:hypothetical protein
MKNNSIKSINTIARFSKREIRKLPTSNGNNRSQLKSRAQGSRMLRNLPKKQLMETISHQTLMILLL